MVSVYKIYDEQDKNYRIWFGDIDDIIKHIEELHITNLEEDYSYQVTQKSWEEELQDFGLTFIEIYNK